MASTLVPLGARVIVSQIQTESKTSSGLIMVSQNQQQDTIVRGTIISAGPDATGLYPGLTVLFNKFAAQNLGLTREGEAILNASEILAVENNL